MQTYLRFAFKWPDKSFVCDLLSELDAHTRQYDKTHFTNSQAQLSNFQVLEWYQSDSCDFGLKVCRIKNKFKVPHNDIIGSYRDLLVSPLYVRISVHGEFDT